MLTRRVIACLDVRDGVVVKGVGFSDLAHAGDPAELARRYDRDGIDELIVLDVTATIDRRRAMAETIRRVSAEVFIPLTVGGGIRSVDDGRAMFDAGADKVSVNSAALARPALIGELASLYGSQAVVVAIDAKRPPSPRRSRDRRERLAKAGAACVFSRSGTTNTSREAVAWAREAEDRGAGEILLTSIDRDGTRAGFDCELTAEVSDAVGIPVIASGGAGSPDHFFDVFTRGRADAALAASIFHFAEHPVMSMKTYLAERGVPMRLC
jgi:imidazole glycerol-phosphate synthase subunit HisF